MGSNTQRNHITWEGGENTMTKTETEKKNYVAIVRVKGSEYAHFVEKIEGDVSTSKFVTVYVTTRQGEKKKITLATDSIEAIEETVE